VKPQPTQPRRLPALLRTGLLAALCTVTDPAHAAAVMLEWNPNTEPDLTTYKVYSGPASRAYTEVRAVGLTNRVVLELPSAADPSYFVVTAVNTLGLESDPSNEVSYQPDASPAPPAAANSSATVPEDGMVTIRLIAEDPDTPDLQFTLLSQPSHGTLSGQAPHLLYTPLPDFHGSDAFVFEVSDGLASAQASVSIAVTPVNDPPAALPQTLLAREDTAAPIQLNALDVDGDSLAVTLVQPPGRGTLSGSGLSLVYTPNPDQNGTDSFQYYVSDGSVSSGTVTVSITVESVNDVPFTREQSFSLNEDANLAFTLAAGDAEGDPLRYLITRSPASGTLSGTAPSLTYTPGPNFNGSDFLEYAVADPTSTSAVRRVSITVNPVQDAPTAYDAAVKVVRNTPRSFQLDGRDADGDALRYQVTTLPRNGTVSGTPPLLTYTPRTGYVGKDTLRFRVADASSTSRVATVNFEISAAAATKLASTETTETSFENSTAPAILVAAGGASSTLTTGASILPGDPAFEFHVGQAPARGTVALRPDGTFTYHHAGGDPLTDLFSYVPARSPANLTEQPVSIHILRMLGGRVEPTQTEIEFSVVRGLAYRVEYQDHTYDPQRPWATLVNLTGELDGTAIVTDRGVDASTPRYYRVRWLGPGPEQVTAVWMKPALPAAEPSAPVPPGVAHTP